MLIEAPAKGMAVSSKATGTQPSSEFEYFSITQDLNSREFLHIEAVRLNGNLSRIRAHQPSRHFSIKYSEIRDIEFSSKTDDFRGKPVAEEHYAVSFRPKIVVTSRAGNTLLPKSASDAAFTRITYWNLHQSELLKLAFLRSPGEKMRLIEGCNEPEWLFSIATANLRTDASIANRAYRKAVKTLENSDASNSEALLRLSRYIHAELKYGIKARFVTAVAHYRKFDYRGEAALELAVLLHDNGKPDSDITPILEEAVGRLLRYKPHYYSVRLSNILHFVIHANLRTPPPEQLLWNAFLAASTERTVWVLRELWMRAVELEADAETLQIIYKTWKGFTA
jgi:hypothetical protein